MRYISFNIDNYDEVVGILKKLNYDLECLVTDDMIRFSDDAENRKNMKVLINALKENNIDFVLR